MLPGSATAAASGLLGFDTDTIVTSELATAFFAQGYRFCIRYVSRASQQGAEDLSGAEALAILGAGLALMVVQHPRAAGWAPTAGLGASDGVQAASHSSALGFPGGVNVWCDLEGVAAGTSPDDVIAYCNSWFDAVAATGYVPGIYVGADAILEGPALHDSLKFAHYWKSLSNVPDIPVRGYQMVQSNEHTANNVDIDDDRTRNDLLNDTVLWLAP